MDLSQRPRTSIVSVGSQRESSMGTGDAECLVCCVKSDLRVGGFVLSMGCGRQTEHAEREVR